MGEISIATYIQYVTRSVAEINGFTLDNQLDSHHTALADDRRLCLAAIYNSIIPLRAGELCPQVDNIVYIGGMLKREVVFPGVNTIFINPVLITNSGMDSENNKAILHLIQLLDQQPIAHTTVHLVQTTLQDCDVDGIRRLLRSIRRRGRTAWVSINSHYYIGDHVMTHVREGDQVFVAGHHFTSSTTMAEIPSVVHSTSKITCGDYYVDMSLSGTTDNYAHSSITMLSSTRWPGPAGSHLEAQTCLDW